MRARCAVSGALVAMVIGVVASSVIHLSQGLMKLGIQRMRTTDPPARARRVYGAGLVLNFSAPFWVMLANPFAPTVYFTSMYAVGLVVLLLFSRWKLDEVLHPRQIAGVVVIILATLVIAGGEWINGTPTMAMVELGPFLMIAGAWLIGMPLLGLMFQRGSCGVREVFFGLAAGGFLGLDALVKGLAQSSAEGSTLLPQSGSGWALLAVSFLGAAGAFGMMQWAFLRHCRASIVAANYNIGYVTVPLLVVPATTAGGSVGWWCLVGLLLLALGAGAMQSGPAGR